MTCRSLALLLLIAALLAGCPTDPAVENQPPSVSVDVGSTVEYVVGEGQIRITVTGEDPEGGVVKLGVVDGPPRARFETYDGWAVFSWDPLASDTTADAPLQLIFYAEDDLGARSERVVNVSIAPGNGVPRFVSSPSILYNVDQNKPLIFDVEVRDDDSQTVALHMPPESAPDGAIFTVTGDMTGRLNWEPTVEQLKYRVHSVTFVANDGLNEPVEQKVSILFDKSGGEDTRPKLTDTTGEPSACAFEDAVRHTPLGAQRGADDYRVEAYLAGAAAEKYDRLVLNWSDQDPWNDYDLQLDGVEMTEEGGIFSAVIPNPLLPAGSSTVFNYEICAIDDDSAEEDAVLCGPTNIYNSFIAYSPENTGVCIDDEGLNQTFDDATAIENAIGWSRYRGCGESRPDYFRLDLSPQQEADLFITYPFGQQVDIEMYDEARNVLPLEASACSGFVYVFVENPEMQEVTRYFRVIARDVPYQVSPWFYESELTCVDEAWEPNETVADAVPIGVAGEVETAAVCGVDDRDVYSFFAFEGEEITTHVDFVHADGDLDLKLYAAGEEAAVDASEAGTRSSLGIDDDEVVTYTAATTGVHYVVVFGYGDDNEYQLTNTVTKAAECTDADAFAPNATQAESKPINFQTYSNLTICGGSEDWLQISAIPGDNINVTVRATNGSLGDMFVTAWNGASLEAFGFRNGDKITLDLFATEFVQYDLEIESSSDVTYELTATYAL